MQFPQEPDTLKHWTRLKRKFRNSEESKLLDSKISQLSEQYLAHYRKAPEQTGKELSNEEIDQIQKDLRSEQELLFEQVRTKKYLLDESERILNILRTKAQGPVLDRLAIRERSAQYADQLDLRRFLEADIEFMLMMGADLGPHEKTTSLNSSDAEIPSCRIPPNIYFEMICPELIEDYGYPFYTTIQNKLFGINTDFFAAYLGGQKRFKHDVVFFLPESKFYFYDPTVAQYLPTTEEKMRIWLSLVLQERAWGQDMDHASKMLIDFRSSDVVTEILGKAKALLAADGAFFEGGQAHPRFVAEDLQINNLQFTVRFFMERTIHLEEKSILTITDFMNGLKSYLLESGVTMPKLQDLKSIVLDAMRQIHGKGLRNDLIADDSKCVSGWKGLRLDNQGLKYLRDAEEDLTIRESGDSVLSGLIPHSRECLQGSHDMALLI